MKKYKLFIVEDDNETLERLLSLLQPYDNLIDFNSLVIARSFLEAQHCIINTKGFDISILDKNLDEGENCFSLISNGNKYKFGLRVFNTIDYEDQIFLKKIEISSGHLVLEKPYTKKGVSALISQITELKNNRHDSATLKTHFTIKAKEGYKIVPIDKIVCLVVKGNLATFHYFNDQNKVVSIDESGQLSNYADDLPSKDFQQIHRGTIINTKFITLLSKTDKELKMSNIEELFSISDSYVEALRQRGLWPTTK